LPKQLLAASSAAFIACSQGFVVAALSRYIKIPSPFRMGFTHLSISYLIIHHFAIKKQGIF